ncbi:MAG TPA: NAD(P)-dependent oxidoreductase, partial [Kofleriaceae bacterium]|nr:NAD(P)-dependent oxidoreductase [Kofleriaceae bacterium]
MRVAPAMSGEARRAAGAAIDYPVCLRLAGRRVLVVGGGRIARGRALGLRDAGARVDVVAPRIDAELEAAARRGELTLVRRAWRADDLAGAAIAVVAIDDRAEAARIAAAARARGVPVTVADQPVLCDFTMPSVGRRGPITLAV